MMNIVVRASTHVKISPRHERASSEFHTMVIAAIADARAWPSRANTANDMIAPTSIIVIPNSHRGCRQNAFFPLLLGDCPGADAASARTRRFADRTCCFF